jgi:hypothetical protein
MRIPADARVYVTEQTFSIVTYRYKNYQVELYLAKPNTTSPQHSHTADQISIFLGGQLRGQRGLNDVAEEPGFFGNIETRPTDLNQIHPDYSSISRPLKAGWWHTLQTYENGFAFFVAQEWNDPTAMTSAIIDWDGNFMGPEHVALIEQ